MPASFGFGVSDFVAVGTLAWKVYKSCKSAPHSFGKISEEVLSLHVVLKEAEETLCTAPSSKTREARLKSVIAGCNNVLTDLQTLLEKYKSLGTQSKKTWDRMKWGDEGIAEIRSRLTSNAALLTAFIGTSQSIVEQKLDAFIEEFRRGQREGSVISVETVDSLTSTDKAAWRAIRKELEDIGITVAAFEANRDYIIRWLVKAVETGAFEEQTISREESLNGSSSSESTGVVSEVSNEEERHEIIEGIRHAAVKPGIKSMDDFETHSKETRRQQRKNHTPDARVLPAFALPDATAENVITNISPSLTHSKTSSVPENKRRPPSAAFALIRRVARLISIFESYHNPLIRAIHSEDEKKALRILNDRSPFGRPRIGLDMMSDALRYSLQDLNTSDHLIDTLLKEGANINKVLRGQTLLMEQVSLARREPDTRQRVICRTLEKGAALNYIIGRPRSRAISPILIAFNNRDEATMRILLEFGASKNNHYHFYSPVSTSPWLTGDRTMLQETIIINQPSIARMLIEEGANVNAISLKYRTPLMLAMYFDNVFIARMLIKAGADVNYHKYEGIEYGSKFCRSPLEAALTGGNASVLHLLFDNGLVVVESHLKDFKRGFIRNHFDKEHEFWQTQEGIGLRRLLWD